MGFLDNLMGNTQQKSDYEDFLRRYEQGHPSEGYDDDEVRERYGQISRDVSPEVYEQSAEEAFQRLSPQERAEFARYLKQRASTQGYSDPDLDRPDLDESFQDPHELARMTSRMRQQNPGMLEQLLGGGGSEQIAGAQRIMENPLAKAALAGIAAVAFKKMMRGRNQ